MTASTLLHRPQAAAHQVPVEFCLLEPGGISLSTGALHTPEELLLAALHRLPAGPLHLRGVRPLEHAVFLQRFLPLACGVGYQIHLSMDRPEQAAVLEPLMVWVRQLR